MINWEDVLEPNDEIDCESCEYYDREEGRCFEWTRNPFDCWKLPCEEDGFNEC